MPTNKFTTIPYMDGMGNRKKIVLMIFPLLTKVQAIVCVCLCVMFSFNLASLCDLCGMVKRPFKWLLVTSK